MWEHSFRDKSAELRLFRSRAILMGLVILLMLGGLVWRMAHLQITLYDKYQNLSENNRIKIQPLPPKRGLIYDRNGELLAENIPTYSLVVVPEKVADMDATLAFLNDMIGISERDREQFDRRLELRRRPFDPVVVRHQLTEDEIAKVMVNRVYLPGVDVEAQLVRHYPQGETFAHVLGYVGRINQSEQNQIDADSETQRRYSATRYIGKQGVEKHYESDLHGEPGYQKVETNARGRILRVLEQVDPSPGEDLVLHLDARMQRLAQQEFTGRRGAAVAIEVETGGILTMYSNPGFDPNLFVTGISHTDYNTLRDSPDLPLFDRAIRGRYPPASTLKPFIGLGVADMGVTTWSRTINDYGTFQLDNSERIYRDWKRGGHGKVDLERAIVESCDVYFYDVAVKAGIDKLEPFLDEFGFGKRTALDVDNAYTGLLPGRDWKHATRRSHWYAGDTVNLGIGQGYMLATPLQMATATAVLAHKGKWVAPRLMASHSGQKTIDESTTPPDLVLNDPSNWDKMFQAMYKVVSSTHGTARALQRNLQFPIAGKTGTAQVVGIKQNEEYDSDALKERLRDHALFIAFAPVDHPQIAVAVVVENGESAGRTAAPIAQSLINLYLGGGEGE
ncbi:penicillin-binding protein 2 [Oceanobacter mangrovi]|uniref:penicillin-binding protein 2 n=1 Tax=Oceanobacter mangrovi TaxID=2862510 RepID=UPI001C8F1541|nr:penicillin-binding protein 2 [Oceanobacter mangrovi]